MAGAGLVQGTWLRSRLARRFFLMFCIAAFVPAAISSWLTWRQANRTAEQAQQRTLRAETRFYGLTTLARLQAAHALLQAQAEAGSAVQPGPVFAALAVRSLQAAPKDPVPGVHVARSGKGPARVSVIVLRPLPDGRARLHAGVLAAGYLWHAEDVVEGTRICAFAAGIALACAGTIDEGRPALRHAWQLDLRAALQAPAWRFEARREPQAPFRGGVVLYALVALGVLLLAILMSLVQIRRTLVPLEALMDRIRAFSGDAPARPERTRRLDELGLLATTFDAMRERIGGQLARLRGLSAVDGAIVSRAPLEAIAAGVLERWLELPGVAAAALRLGEGPGSHVQARAAHGVSWDAACMPPLERQGDAGPLRVPAGWARRFALDGGEGGASVAWLVFDEPGPAQETLDAARQLADRVTIALALDTRERSLVHQSRHDALTGLPNRFAIIETLEAAIAAGEPFAVVFVDLDRFKAVNDGLGHAIGDRLLAEVARRLHDAVGSDGVVARFGGDEFVVLLPGVASAAGVDPVHARIDQALALPLELDGHGMAVRYSAGVALHPADGSEAQDLVRMADVAMYRAKQAGGGRYALYSAGMSDAARAEVELVTALRDALAADALDVHYQPRVAAASGELEGMEALVRWHDGVHGWIPPARFIPLAERHGVIDAVGAFVLRRVCRDIGRWRGAGLTPGRVALNVSSEQLRGGVLLADMARIVESSTVRWDDLEVEITESLLVTDVETASRQLQALRERGTMVAIDDFGTGYSSLAYLARLPLDVIKIDRAFVTTLGDANTAPVVKAVLAMARALGKRVVTEGVETTEQLETLRAWGCDVFQGYLFHRPMPADAIQGLLQAHAHG